MFSQNLARTRPSLSQNEALAEKVTNGAGSGDASMEPRAGGVLLGACWVGNLGFGARPTSDDFFGVRSAGNGDIRLVRERTS